MDKQEKDLLQSKTFWGVIIAGLAFVAHQCGIVINQAVWVNYAVMVVGVAFSFYGRSVASVPVTSILGLTTKSAARKMVTAAAKPALASNSVGDPVKASAPAKTPAKTPAETEDKPDA